MFEFLLALFGGTYYGAKILGEKAELKAYDRSFKSRMEWHNAHQTLWQQQVCDRALEEDLEYFIADPANYDKVWEEVHSAYLQMPSCENFTKILLYEPMIAKLYGKSKYTKKQRENIAAARREDALDIMLAKRGKVRFINTFAGGLTYDTLAGNGEHSKRLWDQDYDMWLYLRNELRLHGVDARAIFKAGTGGEYKQVAYDLDDVDKFRYMSGRFTWLPLTFFDDNLNYVRTVS